MSRRTPAECGTTAGYQRHRRAKERACPRCRAAENAATKARRAATRPPAPPRPSVVCGTRGGYAKHLRNGEPTCQPCKDANTADYHRRRATNTNVEQHRRYVAARGRALSRLTDAHPTQFAALLADELGPNDVVVRQPWKWKAA